MPARLSPRFNFIILGALLCSICLISGCSSKRPPVSTESPLPAVESATPQQTTIDESEGFEEEFGDFEEEFEESNTLQVSDPLAGYNRAMTGFNDKVYFWLLKPTAKGYKFIVPKIVRRGLDNLFTNILFPRRFANNLFQFKFRNAGVESMRFVVNSTIGLAGLMDPAEGWLELKPCDEDFGQTLGAWGVGAGPHLVLPFLGPSNLRDTIALPADWLLNPASYIREPVHRFGTIALETINNTSLHLGEYENLKKDAVDFYPFLRDVYEQNRKKEIED